MEIEYQNKSILAMTEIDIINKIAHTVAFHLTIFTPSSGPKGRRLKVAIMAFIIQIKPKMLPIIVDSKNT